MIHAVMPTYNQAAYLAEAIASVRDQVDQLVVVNDGSTDDTAAVLSGTLGVRVIQHGANKGTAAAINTGVAAILEPSPRPARWLTWVSSDNAHYPHWAETLTAHIRSDVGVVYSGYDARGICPPHYVFRQYDPTILGQSTACFFGPSFIIRADVWQEHEGRMAHDYANWLRVEEACWEKGLRIVGVDEPLCMYRTHRAQATQTARRGDKDAHIWLAEAKERRTRLGIRPPVLA